MPKFLEEKLKREYGANSKIPYKVMNSIGAMRGNKETAKGAEMERKHDRKTRQTSTQKETGFAGSAANYKHSRPKQKVLKRTY